MTKHILPLLLIVASLTACAPAQQVRSYVQNNLQTPCDPSYFLSQPTWSPDSSKIAYVFGESFETDIHLIDLVASRSDQLTSSPGDDESPTWSPDGKSLVFFSDHNLVIMSADGDDIKYLTESNDLYIDTPPSWSPDGAQIAASMLFTSPEYDLYLIDPNTASRMQITTTNDRSPVWSPDGQWIAVKAHLRSQSIFDLAIRDENGILVQTLTNGISIGYVWWSPDSSQLAYQVITNTFDVVVTSRDGSSMTTIFQPNAFLLDLAWSSDGNHLLYITEQEVGSIGVDGQDHSVLMAGLQWKEAQFSPDQSQIAFIQETPPLNMPELYVTSLDGSDTTRLTHSPGNRLCFKSPFQ
jgi:Tol biopolymer transport system component